MALAVHFTNAPAAAKKDVYMYCSQANIPYIDFITSWMLTGDSF